jgi:hypothetical protein
MCLVQGNFEAGRGHFLCVGQGKVELRSNMVEVKQEMTKVSGTTFTPGVIEPSFGIGRIIYCMFEHSFYTREVGVKFMSHANAVLNAELSTGFNTVLNTVLNTLTSTVFNRVHIQYHAVLTSICQGTSWQGHCDADVMCGLWCDVWCGLWCDVMCGVWCDVWCDVWCVLCGVWCDVSCDVWCDVW